MRGANKIIRDVDEGSKEGNNEVSANTGRVKGKQYNDLTEMQSINVRGGS